MTVDTPLHHEPWKHLATLVDAGDAAGLTTQLAALDALDVVRAVSRLTDEQRHGLLELVGPDEAADLIDQIPEVQAVEAIGAIAPETAARILEELSTDAQADLIGELEGAEAEAILAEMPAVEADEIRELAAYPEGTAGSLMTTDHLRFDSRLTVGEVVDDLQQNAEEYEGYDVQYAYVCDEGGRLVGVLGLRDLLLKPRKRSVAKLMIREPLHVRADDEFHEIDAFFDRHHLFGVPAVDAEGRLVGVVRRSAVRGAIAEESEETYRQSQGIVGGEELRSMPLLLRSRRRLAWLSVNILLNVAAASVIALHQETLEAVIALAVFLPIISDMSGCSGSQAVAVSIREMVLGVLAPADVRRVLVKEMATGAINGATLGLLLGGVAWAWKGNPWLGLVTGGALALNTVIAVCIGGVVPLVLRKLGKDPALASGPILTTVTDACGFFLVLSLASLLLPRLV